MIKLSYNYNKYLQKLLYVFKKSHIPKHNINFLFVDLFLFWFLTLLHHSFKLPRKCCSFGSESTWTGKNFLVVFEVKGIYCKGHSLWPVDGAGFEGQGKLSYLFFPAGAKPGGFSTYLPWKERDLEAVSSSFWGLVIFSFPD